MKAQTIARLLLNPRNMFENNRGILSVRVLNRELTTDDIPAIEKEAYFLCKSVSFRTPNNIEFVLKVFLDFEKDALFRKAKKMARLLRSLKHKYGFEIEIVPTYGGNRKWNCDDRDGNIVKRIWCFNGARKWTFGPDWREKFKRYGIRHYTS